ncbi:hypothetical protein HDU93_008620 [Gonapodya sp. JEL0774]|nr:hypothetical protein HDU93_008620 [Gonapodya sp. JEL0774]
MPRSWVSYITRPIWDKDERPKERIPQYQIDIEAIGRKKMCEMHGWKERNETNVELWTATIFSTELPMLLIRLHGLDPIVSRHFIVESTHTFTGIPKPLLLPTALESPAFAAYRHKINYRSIQGRALEQGEDPFVQENENRDAVTAFLLEALQTEPHGRNPVFLFSDVDELISLATARLLQACDFPYPLHLGLRDYLYSFEFEAGTINEGASSWRAHATQWPYKGQGPEEFFRHGKVTERLLVESGWHCSWCFKTLGEFVTKAKGYSHTDRLGNHPTELLKPERIQEVICTGGDMFDMLPEAYTWRELVSKWKLEPSSPNNLELPRLVQERPDEYRWLLPGGCIREQ